jgi:hypothetical protein
LAAKKAGKSRQNGGIDHLTIWALCHDALVLLKKGVIKR